MAHLGLDELADVVIGGSVEGIMKPDPRIYGLAARRLGVRCQTWCFSTISRRGRGGSP
jgi:FMN phosphatase YigB (HAD superfamily)